MLPQNNVFTPTKSLNYFSLAVFTLKYRQYCVPQRKKHRYNLKFIKGTIQRNECESSIVIFINELNYEENNF